jgi:hypothetical protein
MSDQFPALAGPSVTRDPPMAKVAFGYTLQSQASPRFSVAFVTVVFVRLGSVPLALIFGVIGVLCLVVLGWALYRKNRGKRRA